ncbi:MAG: TrmH family RNA methyltransferase [Candidatus Sulfotelmatobacter sp.]
MVDASKLDELVVVLVRPRNPLNIGAVARAMSNFGVRRLRVVNPYEVAFRDARSAVGAAELLSNAEEFSNVAEAIADCGLIVGTTAVHRRVLQNPLRRLDEDGGRVIREELSSGRVALLFGSEKVGLSTADFTHCHWLLHVPTAQDHISMNLGQAVAVCLYEIARSVNGERPAEEMQRASAGEVELITSILLDALRVSGYVKPGTEMVMEEKARRLVRRMNLQSGEATVWLGMLRQIAWKLGIK